MHVNILNANQMNKDNNNAYKNVVSIKLGVKTFQRSKQIRIEKRSMALLEGKSDTVKRNAQPYIV